MKSNYEALRILVDRTSTMRCPRCGSVIDSFEFYSSKVVAHCNGCCFQAYFRKDVSDGVWIDSLWSRGVEDAYGKTACRGFK